MKKTKETKKLEIKKVTLQTLDEPTLDAVAGGIAAISGLYTNGQTVCTNFYTCYA